MKMKYAFFHWASYLVLATGILSALWLTTTGLVFASANGFWESIMRILLAFLAVSFGVLAGTKLEDMAEEIWQEFMKD